LRTLSNCGNFLLVKKLLLISLFAILIIPAAWADSGKLQNVQGDVKIQRSGTPSWIPAESGMSVSAGDRIETGDSGHVTLKLQKASIDLKPNSQFSIKSYETQANQMKTTLRLDLGRLKARVDRLNDTGSMLKIITPTSVASVRGTIFDLDVYEYNGEIYTKVGVIEGSVLFCNADASSCILVSEGETETSDPVVEEIDDPDTIDELFEEIEGFDQDQEDDEEQEEDEEEETTKQTSSRQEE